MSGTRARWLLGISGLLLAGLLVTAAAGGYVAWTAYRGVERGVGTRILERPLPVPSELYGRPTRLEPGDSPARMGLAATLEAAGYRPVADAETVRTGEYAAGEDAWVIGRRRFRHPDGVEEAGLFALELDARGQIVALREARGRSLRSLRLDPPRVGFLHDDSAQVREAVPLAELPPHLVDAFIAIEDHRFHSHRGVDPRRVVGAAVANLLAGRIVQGGSTITQQLARNVYLNRERAFARKVQEAAIALVIEEELDKEQILGAYLDEIYLGQDGALAVHGVGAAARHYFGQDVRDLAVHQSALLAALASGPSRYDPRRDPDAARGRRDLVLRRMRELGSLEPAACEAARALPLDLQPQLPALRSAAFFADHVRRALAGEHDPDELEGGQLRIHTTLDWRLQLLAEQAVREGLEDLETRAPKLLLRDPPVEAALLVLEPESGDILAMVGGRDYGRSQFNRTTQARRQPGSVFKTVVALAALDPPDPAFTLVSTVSDESIVIPAPEPEPGEEPEEDWVPLNHDEEFRGRVTLRQALEDSLNVPMVKVGQEVGLRRVIETARALGIRGRLREVPSLALGTFEVSLLAMTRAYAALAAEGVRTLPRSWSAVTTVDGELLSRQRQRRHRVFGRQEVYLVTSALEGAVDRGTGKSIRALGFRGPLAGKTGSSDDYRDGWFIGYTPELAVGVWVGFDDEGSLGLSGAYTALPIFARFLKAALGPSGGEGFEAPPGVERDTVMARVGEPDAGCTELSDWFVAGTAPRSGCGFFERLPGVGSSPRRGPWWRRRSGP
ncbi:MAG: PBP1A family penicillin-binding protein [Myxococcota bacterium]|nr:PBP1A family penicillin-binding protein [Myxococcota bacterium]